MNSDNFSDSRFLRRWQWWHRFGWPLYLITSIVGSSILVTISVYCAHNLLDHGNTFSAWAGLARSDYFIIAGAVFASVTALLGRFTANETRYERLTKTNRPA